MTKQVIELVECDLDGRAEATTRRIAIDGVEYEIDVCGQHNEELDRVMAPFRQAARRYGGRLIPAQRSHQRARPAPFRPSFEVLPDAVPPRVIRDWWKRAAAERPELGLPQWRSNGPLPPDVKRAYDLRKVLPDKPAEPAVVLPTPRKTTRRPAKKAT